MVARCAEAQWRGLSEAERAYLLEDQQVRFCRHTWVDLWSLWSIQGPGVFYMVLLSVKSDEVDEKWIPVGPGPGTV